MNITKLYIPHFGIFLPYLIGTYFSKWKHCKTLKIIIYVSMKHIFQKKFRGLWVVWRKIFQQSCMYGTCHSAKNWRCGNFLNLSHSRRCRLLYFSRAILWLSQCRTAPPTTSHFRPILGSKSMAPWGEASQIGWSVNVPKIRTKWMVWYQLALAVSFCHLDP